MKKNILLQLICTFIFLSKPFAQNSSGNYILPGLENCEKLIKTAKSSAEKEELQKDYWILLGMINDLGKYRQSFLENGDFINLFPTAYYNTTVLEAERIVNGQFVYPIEKMKQMIAFYEAYKYNRVNWDANNQSAIEPHWKLHFEYATNYLTSIMSHLSCTEVGNTLAFGIIAHVGFDFPRTIKYAFDTRYNKGLTEDNKDFIADYQKTDAIFNSSLDATIADYRNAGWWNKITNRLSCPQWSVDLAKDPKWLDRLKTFFPNIIQAFNADDVINFRHQAYLDAFSKPFVGLDGKSLAIHPNINNLQRLADYGKKICPPVENLLLPFQDKGDKFGYKNKDGNIIISPQFSTADNFSEGLAAAYVNGKCGFIDNTGTFIIKPVYDGCRGGFSEGVCSVILNGKWGVISKTGKVIVPFKYPYLGAFRNGFALFSNDFGKDNNAYEHYGFINKQGKEIIAPKYTFAFAFSEGIAVVEMRKTIGNDIIRQMAFIDTLGRMITEFKYSQAGYFKDGIAPAAIGQKYDKRFGFTSHKVGYIDKTGKQVIPFQWDDGYDFSEGLAPVRQGDNPNLAWNAPGRYGKWGFIDKSGNLKIPLLYDDVFSFCNGIAAVKVNNKWGFIDNNGNMVVEPIYDEVAPLSYNVGLTKLFCEDGLLMATINGAKYYLDKTGKTLPVQYQ